MAELTAVALQNVAVGQNVIFAGTPVQGGRCLTHREGSGLITLRGLTNGQCRARFRASFGANIAVPTGGTAGPISLALSMDGEALASTIRTVTPTAAGAFFAVAADAYIDVPAGCCVTLAVKNVSDQAIDVQNANLIVTREA